MNVIRCSLTTTVMLATFLFGEPVVAQQPAPPSTANSLVSQQACRAQFRYLRQALHAIDLKGAPVMTDGVSTHVAEAEWPFMAVAYYGYACADLAQCDPTLRGDAITEMRWALDALQTPRLSGFMVPHFGAPFGNGSLTPSVFVHGHFLNLAVRYREVTGDAAYDALMLRIATALDHAYTQDAQGLLPSYMHPPMWWLTDNCPALSALARYDRLFQTHFAAGKEKFVASVKAYYLDPKTGMFCTYANPPTRQAGQGPRGISMMYGLHFLKDFAPEDGDKLYYRQIPEVGQAMILFGRTELWKRANERTPNQ
ncbi:MAG TPA: hypothetical protein VK961_04535 [Chthoniobacter sp.]|nr:hypothetical protein [Chthoniobacter sp.]